jgi:hypothetical protein
VSINLKKQNGWKTLLLQAVVTHRLLAGPDRADPDFAVTC